MPSVVGYIPAWDTNLIGDFIKAAAKIKAEVDEANIRLSRDELLHRSQPYVMIYSSWDGKHGLDKLIWIANQLVGIMDVELFHPTKGIMAFREKGDHFTNTCFPSDEPKTTKPTDD